MSDFALFVILIIDGLQLSASHIHSDSDNKKMHAVLGE